MPAHTPALTAAQIDAFITDGFVRIDNAFPADLAAKGRAILWMLTGLDPDDPSTWTKPVIRLGDNPSRSVPRSRKHAGPDALPTTSWSAPAAGCHAAASARSRSASLRPKIRAMPAGTSMSAYGWEEHPTDFMAWRANVYSKGRALLMLFLFSEVGEHDAPTRIRVGSHLDIARQLAPAGEAGLSLRELAADNFAASAHRPEVLATGSPGTVYLCHPFLVHAAQPHHGTEPRFMAQPPLMPSRPLSLERSDGDYSPVEIAIRRAIA